MHRSAQVFFKEHLAGVLAETDQGYSFVYDETYRQLADSKPVSLTLPLREKTFTSTVLFPFFDGLIPEGWLLDVAVENWKIKEKDRFGLLLACCKNCIGAVSIEPVHHEEL